MLAICLVVLAACRTSAEKPEKAEKAEKVETVREIEPDAAPPEPPREKPTGMQAVIAYADRVEAYRLLGDPMRKYVRTAGPIAVPATSAVGLRRVLSQWKPNGPWAACMAKPGVELVFHRGSDEVHVFLCFGCRLMSMTTAVPTTPAEDFYPFDAEHRELLKLVKRIFPRDEELADL
jgi:hypothetical protein